MADYETVVRRPGSVSQADIDVGLRAYMNKVYSLMGVAMIITGVVAYVFGNDLYAAMRGQETMIVPNAVLATLFTGPIRWVVMFAPLIFVFAFAAGINRMSASTAQMVFWAFAAVMGISISSIFAVYTGMSIAQTFFVTAIAFLGLSLYGYTTKKDLSGWGSFLIMGVIGLIVASIVNIFLASSALQFAISVLGVLIFAGLTAYDTQRLKNEYLHFSQMGREGAAILAKGAIMGALSLYINFLNMFMFLLQFMGAARE
ncbi:MAG: Bax inhibitor-1/YccA family protein [Pseudomonadota bacterium]